MPETWVDRTRNRMQMLGTAQEQLAARLGCTRGAVGHYLSGRRDPTLDQLSNIARCLDVSPAWLFFGISETEVREEPPGYSSIAQSIPITGTTETGAHKKQLGHIEVPKPTANSYALIATGARWAPRIYAGEAVLIEPDLDPEPGDEVLINHLGEIKLYNLIKKTGKQITVGDFEGKNKRYILEQSDIKYVHTIIAVFRTNKVINNPDK